jgi:hypothetical protein
LKSRGLPNVRDDGNRGIVPAQESRDVNVWQVGLVVRSGLSALVAGAYSARDIGLSRTEIRNGVSLTTALVGALLTIECFGGKLRKRK